MFFDKNATGNATLLSKLSYYRITAFFMSDEFPYFPPDFALPAYEPHLSSFAKAMHPKLRRYLMTLFFLRSRYDDYDFVMLSDTRDVIFQTDPFDWSALESEDAKGLELGDKLFVFEEHTEPKIGYETVNSAWTVQVLGIEALLEIASAYFGIVGYL
jgi:hypothetical protein